MNENDKPCKDDVEEILFYKTEDYYDNLIYLPDVVQIHQQGEGTANVLYSGGQSYWYDRTLCNNPDKEEPISCLISQWKQAKTLMRERYNIT